MKITLYPSVAATHFDNDKAQGVTGRVVISNHDGADHFCMRVFEIVPGGYTPRHSHDWEHEIFVHKGIGQAYGDGQWHPLSAGSVIFIPSGEEHQIRNTGDELLIFICLIPAGAPEL